MHKRIAIRLYKKEVLLVVGTLPQLRTTLAHFGLSMEPASAHIDGLALKVENSETFEVSYVVWINEQAPTPLSTLVHELTHITFYVLDDVGVKFDVANHEAFAYLLDYLFSEGKVLFDQSDSVCDEPDGVSEASEILQRPAINGKAASSVDKGGYLGGQRLLPLPPYPTH